MRTKLIAGNWKMNNTPDTARRLISDILAKIGSEAACDVAVCVPSVCLEAASQSLKGSSVLLGAQNVHYEASGAFTGELSADMLTSVGAGCVIIGHSERRQYFGETDETVNKRPRAALKAGLMPIVCGGESKDQRLTGYTNPVVSYQTKIALTGVTAEQLDNLVIAYDPVLAIGTGLTATDEQANETIGVIRHAAREVYGSKADGLRILYGGSMNDENAASLLAQPEIDGGLIGGASLKADKFAAIVKACE